MQCAECREVYSDSLDVCPQCQQPTPRRAPAARAARAERRATAAPNGDSAQHSAGGTATATATQAAAASTLIEFPGSGRAARPQWRKDLSERVREIQQRRAREAALERDAALAAQGLSGNVPPPQANAAAGEASEESRSPALAVVPQPEAPEMNPIVAAALRRLERARQPLPPSTRARTKGGAAAAAAVAYDAEETYRPEPSKAAPVRAEATPAPATNTRPEARRAAPPAEAKHETTHADESSADTARAASLVVVPAAAPSTEPTKAHAQATTQASAASEPTAPHRSNGTAARQSAASPVAPEVKQSAEAEAAEVESPARRTRAERAAAARDATRVLTERREAEITDAANCVPVVESAFVCDRAPMARRFAAGAFDLFVAAVCTLPFAAIIELTSGRWEDPRVLASMGGIHLLVAFLYFVVATGLFGRTLGMRLFGLRAVDARNALVPTTAQSVRRAFFYLLSLATFGLGLFFAFFDAEGRTAHDHLSGTIVVRE